VAEHWAYFGDEVDALAERRNLSREDAREALLDEVEGGLRQSEAKVWVAREVEGCWLCELVYDPAHDPPAFEDFGQRLVTKKAPVERRLSTGRTP